MARPVYPPPVRYGIMETRIAAMNVTPDTSATPFVDLYSVLGVAPDSPTADLRRRIALLYIEAQDNLDHRSFRKRFYYHELYEVHLPHSHHVLLDETRRAAYDAERARALRNRTSGQSAAPASAPPTSAPATSASASVRQTSSDATPDRRTKDRSTPGEATSGEATPAHQKPEYHDTLARDLNVERKPRPPAPEWARMDRATVERRRDSNRRELIKQELQLAGQRAGAGAGALSLAVATGLWIGGINLDVPLAALGIMGAVALAVTFFVARTASRGARRNIVATLSKMPYEELLLRTSR